jgi:hypothetical protein
VRTSSRRRYSARTDRPPWGTAVALGAGAGAADHPMLPQRRRWTPPARRQGADQGDPKFAVVRNASMPSALPRPTKFISTVVRMSSRWWPKAIR